MNYIHIHRSTLFYWQLFLCYLLICRALVNENDTKTVLYQRVSSETHIIWRNRFDTASTTQYTQGVMWRKWFGANLLCFFFCFSVCFEFQFGDCYASYYTHVQTSKRVWMIHCNHKHVSSYCICGICIRADDSYPVCARDSLGYLIIIIYWRRYSDVRTHTRAIHLHRNQNANPCKWKLAPSKCTHTHNTHVSVSEWNSNNNNSIIKIFVAKWFTYSGICLRSCSYCVHAPGTFSSFFCLFIFFTCPTSTKSNRIL